jgi:ribosome assembly protein 4
MPIPTALALAAALGSLVTSTKSGWELSRMVRQKHDRIQAEKDSVQVYRSLRKALHSGRMSEKEYDQWYEKFLVAESEKNRQYMPSLAAFACPY